MNIFASSLTQRRTISIASLSFILIGITFDIPIILIGGIKKAIASAKYSFGGLKSECRIPAVKICNLPGLQIRPPPSRLMPSAALPWLSTSQTVDSLLSYDVTRYRETLQFFSSKNRPVLCATRDYSDITRSRIVSVSTQRRICRFALHEWKTRAARPMLSGLNIYRHGHRCECQTA